MPDPRLIAVLAEGQKCLDLGHSAAAEFVARDILDVDPANPEALNLLGRAQMALGLNSHACEAFNAALAANPYFKAARKNLADAQKRIAAATAPASPPPGAGYLVIREWMEGFWSDVDHVLGAAALAEVTGRTPVVWWGSQSRYRSPRADNAWPLFFEPLSAATIDDIRRLPRGGTTCYPSKWTIDDLTGPIRGKWTGPESRRVSVHFLSRREDVLVSDFHTGLIEVLPYFPADHPLRAAAADIRAARRLAVARYLRPVESIRKMVDEFAAAHFDAPMLGVHLRGTDKVTEQQDLAGINALYPQAIQRHLAAAPGMKIFLLTDSDPFAQWCRSAYPGRVVTTDAQRASGDVALHYMPGHGDPSRLGVEVTLDTLLAARCQRFIGLGTSNVSCYVRDLKDWTQADGSSACELFSIVHNDRRNSFLQVCGPPPNAP